MHLVAKTIRILLAKFDCNRLTTVQDIQDYMSLFFGTQCIYTCILLFFILILLYFEHFLIQSITFLYGAKIVNKSYWSVLCKTVSL